jgi:uridine kinase
VTDLLGRLDGRRFVLIDGPAGSGKTTLAATLDAPVVHMDDLYDGWGGLEAGIAQAQALVDALAAGRPAGYRRFDWVRGEYAEWIQVPPTSLLVIEGCGSGSVRADALLVWVEADAEERLRRGVERDGEAMRAQWLRWKDTEQEVFGRDRTHERAEVRVATSAPRGTQRTSAEG